MLASPRWSIPKVTFFFIVLLNDQKYQKSSKDFPSLENLPASSRFALCKQPSPSGANIASEPSDYSIVTATGSKRSSADSDSLLCHVGLWRTSRFRFGCGTGCEHSKIRVCFGNPVRALTLFTPAAPIYAGVQAMRARICSASSCDMFARVV